jgi:hypothetical protein
MRLAPWPSRIVLAAALASCGSRTGLLVSDGDPAGQPDAASVHVTPDASPPSACADAGTQVFYIITDGNNLVAFDPPSNTFRPIGPIRCPGIDSGQLPFSMAVDRSGTAYTVYDSGAFFELHPSASGVTCTPVAFSTGGDFPQVFGMGFSGDAVGGGETLYIAGALRPYTLARVPIPGFTAQPIGALVGLVHPELTGNGGGDLFAFSGVDCGPIAGCVASMTTDCIACSTSSIAQLDKTTGKVVAVDVLRNFDQGDGWAFGFWGGVFYIFTAPETMPGVGATSSLVTRFDPATQSLQQVNTYPQKIVGAGVSTCAPLGKP